MSVSRVGNLDVMWIILIIAGFGIGGIVVPASIITTIICPDDLIATIAALTLSIRVIGGAIGYSVYYNVFVNKFVPAATHCESNPMPCLCILELTVNRHWRRHGLRTWY